MQRRKLKDQIQSKISSAANHVDEVVGYSVALGAGTAPVWVSQITGYLQLVAVSVAIVVGLTTYHLNVLKIRKLKAKKDKEDV